MSKKIFVVLFMVGLSTILHAQQQADTMYFKLVRVRIDSYSDHTYKVSTKYWYGPLDNLKLVKQRWEFKPYEVNGIDFIRSDRFKRLIMDKLSRMNGGKIVHPLKLHHIQGGGGGVTKKSQSTFRRYWKGMTFATAFVALPVYAKLADNKSFALKPWVNDHLLTQQGSGTISKFDKVEHYTGGFALGIFINWKTAMILNLLYEWKDAHIDYRTYGSLGDGEFSRTDFLVTSVGIMHGYVTRRFLSDKEFAQKNWVHFMALTAGVSSLATDWNSRDSWGIVPLKHVSDLWYGEPALFGVHDKLLNVTLGAGIALVTTPKIAFHVAWLKEVSLDMGFRNKKVSIPDILTTWAGVAPVYVWEKWIRTDRLSYKKGLNFTFIPTPKSVYLSVKW